MSNSTYILYTYFIVQTITTYRSLPLIFGLPITASISVQCLSCNVIAFTFILIGTLCVSVSRLLCTVMVISGLDENMFPTIDDRYYSISDFGAQCNDENRIIFHQNIRSFNRNFDYFSSFIGEIDKAVDIIVMSETYGFQIATRLILKDITPSNTGIFVLITTHVCELFTVAIIRIILVVTHANDIDTLTVGKFSLMTVQVIVPITLTIGKLSLATAYFIVPVTATIIGKLLLITPYVIVPSYSTSWSGLVDHCKSYSTNYSTSYRNVAIDTCIHY